MGRCLRFVAIVGAVALVHACSDDHSSASGTSEGSSSTGAIDGSTGGSTSDESTGAADTSDTGGQDSGPISVDLEGAVAKGPFLLGSSVEIAELDTSLSPTGASFSTQTISDLGEFAISVETSGVLSIEAVGFYYNEVNGALSTSPLTLRAFYQPTDAGLQPACVNIITHLAYARVGHLYEGGAELEVAVAQAEDELLSALGVGVSGFDPEVEGNQMSLLGGDTDANAYLFAVATVLAQASVTRAGGLDGPVDANLQELVNTISSDFELLGQVAPAMRDELLQAQRDVDPAQVMTAFANRLEMLGSRVEVPDLDRVLDSDLDDVVNADDNCRLVVNADQADGDADGVGDACECGNGVVDVGETCDDANPTAYDGCEPDCTASCVSILEGADGEAFALLGLIDDALVFSAQGPDMDYEPLAFALARGGDPVELGSFGGRLFALGDVHVALGNTVATAGLWATDGTAAGTSLIADVDTGAGIGFVHGDQFLFGADDGSGYVLWSSDGTVLGTASLATGAPISAAATLDGIAYFHGHPNHSNTLWSTDGTGPGTDLVHDFGALDGIGHTLVAVSSGLLTRSTQVAAQPLWVSDGTPGGTTNLAVPVSLYGDSADTFAVLDGVAYFAANQAGISGLWRSDGTVVGTFEVEAFAGDTGEVTSFQTVGDQIAFIRRVGGADDELWMGDGTAAGTSPVAVALGEVPTGHPPIGANYYFVADDGSGPALWRSDGTVGGTVLLLDAGGGGSEYYGAPLDAGEHAYVAAFTSDGVSMVPSLYRCSVPI